ncbi:GGDEF domain-containing protein [Leucobacter sp. 7(1)]|uniref:GGDEF domain-containing protein n=1 Tax=Leucobacter sp. 7(1) TaxID=1255613 RepID=UPI0020CDEA07|nr:GGDEF domain-containing protein [Leucobacter sp. 7(1)]
MTLVVDLMAHTQMENRWFVWALLGFCVAGSFATLWRGRRVPRWVGLTSVFVFLGAQTYFLSLPNDPPSVIASVQQLPVVAFYLGWFVRPKLALIIMGVSATVFSAVMIGNPLFDADGAIGAPVAMHGILGMLFCFTAGMYLWRRQLRIASVDQLTGAQNRQGLNARLSDMLRKRAISRAPFVVVAIDLDDFKQLNDARGHAAGDLVLSRTVHAWREVSRTGDVVARLGGDEFALLLPNTNTPMAAQIVERLQGVSEHPWSWGIAEVHPGDTAEALFARADASLYENKRERRAADAVRRAGEAVDPGLAAGSDTVAALVEAPTPEARQASLRARVCAWVRQQADRLVRWQTPFSFVSSLIPLLLAVVLLSDLVLPHPGLHARSVVTWLSVYVVAGVVPLVLGHRYPRWAGIVMIAIIEVWSAMFLLTAQHPHAEINALLELPVIALYVGWFYSSVIARVFMACSVLRVAATLLWNPELGHGLGSPVIMVSYSVLIALFCFEGARGVRRLGQVQVSTDPLTLALNRRGLITAGAELRHRARRAGGAVSVALIDFDRFKQLNESGGHSAGDAALRDTVRRWITEVGMRGVSGRSGGIVSRLGGDEFVIVFLAERAVAQRQLERMAQSSAYAWSWGLVEVPEDEELDAAIVRADARLYAAKAGR